MVYDSTHDRFILFGGWDRALNNETWSYDNGNRSWTKMRSSSSPTAREGHAAAYDSRAEKMILFGGANGSSLFRETWAYDLKSNAWTDLLPPNPPPGGSYYQSMAYDSNSDRIVLFGGYRGPYEGGNDTWIYDYNTNSWTNVTSTQTTRPAARGGYALAYDSKSDRTIMFGGQASTDWRYGETWAYDFNNNIWTNMHPSPVPSSRYQQAVAYDSHSDRIVLFGGFAATGVNGETWAYDFTANKWASTSSASSPQGRYGHTLAYDDRLNASVLFGGDTNAGTSHELWAYRLETTTWTRDDPIRPAAPLFPAMTYDARSDRIILFVGTPSSGWWSETWAYDLVSNEWAFMDPSPSPIPTIGSAMAYDSRANLTIMFGGEGQGGTWAYDSELNAWTILQPFGSPSARGSPAMAYDSKADRIILFGGDTGISPNPWNNETWAYDFNTDVWTDMTPSQTVMPSGRSWALMAYDSLADRFVLFGGGTGGSAENDTWAYDYNNNTWTNMVPAMGPPSQAGQAMAYDSSLDRVVLYGSGETWAYDFRSNSWTNLSSHAAPSPGIGQAMAYDTQSGRIVLFGYDDIWWGRLLVPPSAPLALRSSIVANNATLSWEQPVDDGGSPISAYRIYRGTSPGTEALRTEVGNVLTYDDRGLTNGVTYYYQISAVNGMGEGQRSAELGPSLAIYRPPPSVAYTLALLNNTLIPGNFLGANGGSPVDATYDTGKGEVYITNYYPDTVSVISGVTHTVVATIGLPAGSSPQGVAYDAGKGEVFVANYGSDTVSVISDTTHTVVATIGLPAGSSPQGVAYDAGKGEVFVANYGSDTVSVISDTTHMVLASIFVESRPSGVAYDAGKGEVFVANSNSNTVSVISDLTNTAVASIPVGNNPTGVVYDAAEAEIFVSSYPVSVISDVSNTVVATIAVVDHPWGLAYDGGKGEVFLAMFSSDTVSIVSDATNTIIANVPTGYHPRAVAYDGVHGQVFVGNYGAGNVSVIADATNAVVATIVLQANPSGLAYDAGRGEVFIADNFRDIVSVISERTNTVVATIPLPAGSSPWGIAYDSGKGEIFMANRGTDTISVISDATNAVVATIPVAGPFSLAYDSGKGEIFAVSGSRTVDVISDATNTVVATIPFAGASNLWGLVYDSGKGEVFVSDQGIDIISVISDKTNTVVATISLFVGGGPVGLVYDSNEGLIFYANINSNNVRAISDATNAVVANIPVGGNPIGLAYDSDTGEIFVANSGTGCCDGGNTISVISVTTSTVVATVKAGGNPFWAAYDPATESVYVANPPQGTVSIISPEHLFNITFTESGLPPGGAWSVTLNGTPRNSIGPSITFAEPKGPYSFVIGQVPGYTASPASGEVTVSGADVALEVVFAVVRYPVTMTETGLPVGTEWWVNLSNGESFEAASSGIDFMEPNRTYSFSISTTDKRYSAAGGTLAISGSPVSASVNFSPVIFAVTFAETGLRSGASWSVTVNGVSESSTGTSIVDSEMNGSYSYTISGPGGYIASAVAGTFTVRGMPISLAIQFTPTTAVSSQLYDYLGGAVALVAAVAIAFVLVRRKSRRPPEGV